MIAFEYYQNMTYLADTMTNIGHLMTEKTFISYILAGLGLAHGDLFTSIMISVTTRRLSYQNSTLSHRS